MNNEQLKEKFRNVLARETKKTLREFVKNINDRDECQNAYICQEEISVPLEMKEVREFGVYLTEIPQGQGIVLSTKTFSYNYVDYPNIFAIAK